ncbi:hypothetical protein [Chiayiivirga flava]|uniref:Uncharacterized protein n=1 Tax=Chiayiivirga flava TaxID=659595 RepID=A0A7W8D424_9GAMM|nr:hypothetical protein [Chiayiivirga flava]MBB5207551.1 hypothetical protein [Chiayiivirga flava]
MKKALGGCLVVGLLVLVIGGGALWWFVLKPAWHAGSEFMGAATQFAEIAQIEAKVSNRTPYSAPADGTIPPETWQRFVAVQRALQVDVGDTLAVLEAKYKEIEARTGNGSEPGLTDLLGAYGDLFGLIRDAKLAQVDALNAQGMSLEEYRWVRAQAYAALGLAGADADATPTPLQGSAIARNAELVREQRALLTQTAATAWLGF